jgi:hypothetical protein
VTTHQPAISGRDAEYDRFGPWVVEIDAEDPPPPIFEPHLTRADEALLQVKVPRKIARRDAHPGMDLYDFVISLYDHELLILERVGHEVRERTIRHDDITHLSITEDLLRGILRLGLPRDTCELPYNTVSSELMRRLMAIIRERYLKAEATATPAALPATPAIDELSFYFERLLKQEQLADDRLTLLAAQPDLAMLELESDALRKLLFGLMSKRLLESIHLVDGRELRIIDRGRPIAYRWQSTYGRRETIIPLANISDVSFENSSGATKTLTIGIGDDEVSWLFDRDNASAAGYAQWLRGLV